VTEIVGDLEFIDLVVVTDWEYDLIIETDVL